MQSDKTIEIVGKMRAPFRLADAEGLLFTIVGRYQMVDAGEQRAELFAILTMPPTAMPPKPTP